MGKLTRLRRISLQGFKSIKSMDLELGPLTVMVGANGAGKSNLISFFKMLNELAAGRLQQYVAVSGRAHSLLHFGPKITPQIKARLEFDVNGDTSVYSFRLFHAATDTLVFAEETTSFHRAGRSQPQLTNLGPGHLETLIPEKANSGDQTAQVFRRLLNRCRVYHFHDTSPTTRARQYGYIGDNRWLMPDAGNIAAYLRRLREDNHGVAYRRIVKTIKLIAPFFADFELEPAGPNGLEIMLNWRGQGTDELFGPHQLSDGTLRAISLITLLMQPEEELPHLIIVDEPELGLHPYALNVIAALFKRASDSAQILISTQSSAFLDNFAPTDIVVVNRVDQASQFERPDESALEQWLTDYSLGEVWEQNIFGGGPQ